MSDPVLIRRTRVEHGRNRAMTHRLFAEADPFTGSTEAVPAELALVKRIGEVLDFHYPGHPWAVEVNKRGGYAKITIPDLLGPNWGMVLHLDRDITDAMIVRCGGEILERFKLPRAGIDIAGYLRNIKTIPLIGGFRAKHRHLIPA